MAKVFVYLLILEYIEIIRILLEKNCFAGGINDNVTYHQLKHLFILRHLNAYTKYLYFHEKCTLFFSDV